MDSKLPPLRRDRKLSRERDIREEEQLPVD
jgi:hypothetical protein